MEKMKVTLVEKIGSVDEEKLRNGKVINLSDLNGSYSYNFQINFKEGKIYSRAPRSTMEIGNALNKLKGRGVEVREVYVCPSQSNPSQNNSSLNLGSGV